MSFEYGILGVAVELVVAETLPAKPVESESQPCKYAESDTAENTGAPADRTDDGHARFGSGDEVEDTESSLTMTTDEFAGILGKMIVVTVRDDFVKGLPTEMMKSFSTSSAGVTALNIEVVDGVKLGLVVIPKDERG